MKLILGLDIGTNSIGWALIELDIQNHSGRILGLGSRIIPMEGREKDFEAGTSVSKTADRRQARTARRLLQRYKLRRGRLIKVFKMLGWFPESFPENFKELSKFNINDHIPFSERTIAEARTAFNTDNISTDWIIYFLRTKALSQNISLAELARIIYHLNQRRGFKSSRKDKKDEDQNEEVKYPLRVKSIEIVKINSITQSDEKSKYGQIFHLNATSADKTSYTGTIARRTKPEWENTEIELELTRIISKNGEERVEFRLPDRTDWEKMKVALEKDIKESGLFPGEYHFKRLLQDRNYRIKDRVIDRSFYQQELDAIWKKQSEFHPELSDTSKLEMIARELYKHNEAKQKEIAESDLLRLVKNDIIYYQRDLKSQKHLIGECNYEKRYDAAGKAYGVKVAPKSSPSFQEFRIWQDIHNLRVIRLEKKIDGKTCFEIDETSNYLDHECKSRLFRLFDSREKITCSAILKELNLSDKTHRLNYPADKEFKGNETKATFRKVFRKHKYEAEGEAILNDKNKFEAFWHILYSLRDERHVENAVKKHFGFTDELAKHLSRLPEFPSQYASYSAKAINKLLSLIRCGEQWNQKSIPVKIQERIEKIITGEVAEEVSLRTREKIAEWEKKNRKLTSITDFNGLPLWLAAYVVYGRHAERENEGKYEKDDAIKLIEHGELRNPIVEQVTNETLQVIKEIWKQYGKQPDKIHIELARDLKKNAEERQKINEQNTKNESDRKRIVAILKELRNANPDSMSDIDRLRLWEETGNAEARNTVPKFSKEPTKAEIEKYKLWGEQNHISPYTGRAIPLSKLFTPAYQIEHIIPRSRYFDDSFANKTICEAEVNSFKDNSTAMQMINEHGGREIEYKGKKFKLLSPDDYIEYIKKSFNGKKKKHFLSESVPNGFIERQLNDTRYIGRKLGELLHPIAKEEVVFTIGQITSDLKAKWGLNRVWKEILKPRFERLEVITGEQLIDFDNTHNDIHFKKEYKRIDHRHHALDALVIACTTRSHIQYLSTLNSQSDDPSEKQKYNYLVKSKVREFKLPWDTFTKEARESLQEIVVSHKNRTRVITKGFNLYTKWTLDNGKWVKKPVKQEKGKLISVRKSMFKEPLGIVHLAECRPVVVKQAVETQFNYLAKYQSKLQPRIANKELRNSINTLIRNCEFDLEKTLKFIKANPLKDKNGVELKKIDLLEFNSYSAKRRTLNKDFKESTIQSIPYWKHSKLARVLLDHLNSFNGDSTVAFTGEGLELLAKKWGKPINKITIYEEVGNKINFKGKLVEADKGSNMFFAMDENIGTGERTNMRTIPLLEVIERKANGLPIIDEKPGYRTIVLSPNDLVYVPEPGENVRAIDWEKDKKRISERIYKVVSFTGTECQFLPHYVSALILPYDSKTKKGEFGSLNKSERSLDNILIKKVCVKVSADKLGNIFPAGQVKPAGIPLNIAPKEQIAE